MSFLTDIEKENKILYTYVQSQIVSVANHLNEVQNIFQEYTDHSITHSQRVLENGELLHTSDLSIYEKAIFILAAYFHDTGMNVSQDKIDDYISSIGNDLNIDFLLDRINDTQNLKNANNAVKKKFMALDHFREIHGKLSSEYILTKYPKTEKNSWVKDVYLWDFVARVCEAHTFSLKELKQNEYYSTEQYLENRENVDLLYISLLLRLSDICHFSRDRAYPYIFKTKEFISDKSKDIWNYYSCVVNTVPDKNSNSIRIQASCDNIHQHRSIISESMYISNELLSSHKLLASSKSKHSFNWKFIDTNLVKQSSVATYNYIESKFDLNKNKIINLLMGEKLYSNKLFAIRECIQNSIDSIKISSSKTNSQDYIYINYFDTVFPIMDIFDSGTGMNMNIISENFLSVGTNSFWKSDKGIKEWEIDTKKINLIADHGIGALSYFMIAKNVEIFTKYKKEEKYIHILIDDYRDSVIHKNTDIKDFPTFTSIDLLPTPWDLMHGTCVRFKLKQAIDFKELIEFLSVHILRSPYPIFLNYNNVEYALKNVWHLRERVDKHLFPKEKYRYHYDDYFFQDRKEKTQAEILDDLYTEKYDFYGDHPPKDPAVINNILKTNGINGRINLNYWDESNIACRVSQNGILIQNAIEFISKNKYSNLLLRGYGFDIDLSGYKIFQLDAERTNIIDNEYNKNTLHEIEKCFDEYYFDKVSQIESSIYFRCGGHFYHGIADILFEHPDSIKCFSKNFSQLHKDGLFTDYSDKLSSFDDAKIFMTGLIHNHSISINEIKKIKKPILIFPKRFPLSSNGLTKSSHGEKYVDLAKLEKKYNIKMNDKMIYLSDYKFPFIEPLFRNFDLKINEENKYLYLIELVDGTTSIENPIRKRIEKVFSK